MLIVFVLLILALLAKDTMPLGDRYILRGLSEGIALLVGCGGIAMSGIHGLTWRHAGLGLYLAALILAVPQAEDILVVGFQVLAVMAIVAFSFAFLNEARLNRRLTLHVARAMLVALTLVCLASLIVQYWHPDNAYEQTFEGPRFRGLFSKPAMMGAASGLLLGLGLFVTWNWGIRILALVTAFPCLLLTHSRTFWVAAMVATGIAGFGYLRWRVVRSLAGVALIMVIVCLCLGIGSQLRLDSLKQSSLLRQDSIETFSGRTVMWKQALQQYWKHPWLGYGFTAGGMTLEERDRRGSSVVTLGSPSQGSLTLHNGYVQALLDSGGIGAALYAGVIISALICFVIYDRNRQYGGEFYCLLFLAIANLGETVIFGAGVLHGVWYWYLTVLALSLPSLVSPGAIRKPLGSVVQSAQQAGKPAGYFEIPLPAARRFSIVAPRKGLS